MIISTTCGRFKRLHMEILKQKNKNSTNPKPPLKWAGGKRWLVPHLLPVWQRNNNRRLVEPFSGGLAVTLGLMPEQALLNDFNEHLVNFFNQVKSGFIIDFPMENDKELYYQYRDKFNKLLKEGKQHTGEAAGLFYYLNRTGFNGLCRFNRKGFFNVPFGSYKKINYRREFSSYEQLFKSWSFQSGDFEVVKLEKEDFVYADPPYDVEFTQYSEKTFNWEDQKRLGKWLAGHKGPVVLSNQATERVVELYKNLNFKLYYLNGPRRISCTGERTPAKEVLAVKGIDGDIL